MPGLVVAAKVWRWTPWERSNAANTVSDQYIQIAGIAPSYRGVRLNPYENGTATARAGRVLKGKVSSDATPIGRHTTNTGSHIALEGAAMLMDVTTTVSNQATKWLFNASPFLNRTGDSFRFVEWEWPRLVKADGIWLSTANDCALNLGRRPVSWNLDAFLPGRGWHRVYAARSVTPPTTNQTWYGPFEFRKLIPVSSAQ